VVLTVARCAPCACQCQALVLSHGAGSLPEFVPFPFAERWKAGSSSSSASRAAAHPRQAAASAADDRLTVRLRRLRHPLLLAAHLEEKQRTERRAKVGMAGASSPL
jgi:hypothetical protein